MDSIEVYTDGSYRDGLATWAYIVVQNDKILYSDSGTVTDNEMATTMWNVAGEIEAATQAIKWAVDTNTNIILISDYQGIQGWATTWKTNTKWTEAYAKYAKENKEKISEFKYVRAHSRNKWNDHVDKLAFERLNIVK